MTNSTLNLNSKPRAHSCRLAAAALSLIVVLAAPAAEKGLSRLRVSENQRFLVTTDGCNEVWQMWDTGRKPLIGATRPWHEAIHLPGAGQMRPARTVSVQNDIPMKWILKTLAAGVAASVPLALTFVPMERAFAAESAPDLKLLFSGPQDLSDTWGKLHFAVTPIRLIRKVAEPPFAPVGCFPLADGTWEVFGQELKEMGRGKASHEETNAWKIVRATTRDGETFAQPETVLEQAAGPWTQHAAMAFNPEAKEYLLLKLKMDSSGFAYTAFFSSDGKRWRAHPGNPLFYEGDAMTVFWSPALKRFILVSKSLQPFRKHIRDHGGPTKSLKDDALRDRRVLMLRSSPDGRRWEPSVSLPDVWDRHGQKGSHPPGFLTLPDADDPPDLEFYSGNGFWHYDRAYMMVLNYAASPLAALKHAPHLDNEWWTSPDGLRWERPARGVNALEVFPQVPRLEMPPMILGGNLLWRRGTMLLGLPEDRITGVSARANGEFSTKAFKVPDADLLLNAAVPAPERSFAKEPAYVMVAALDEKGQVVPGFEADKCVIQNEDRRGIPLKWGDASAGQLAGKTIRLRFFLRSANIYAVTARFQP